MHYLNSNVNLNMRGTVLLLVVCLSMQGAEGGIAITYQKHRAAIKGACKDGQRCVASTASDAPADTHSFCQSCPSGRTKAKGATDNTEDCGGSTVSSTGTLVDATGTTANNIAFDGTGYQAACTACPAGQFSGPFVFRLAAAESPDPTKGNEGEAFNSVLEFGGPRNKGTSASCTDCPKGKFAPDALTSECTACPVGKFQAQGGQTKCETCPAGRSQAAAEGTDCDKCSDGTSSVAGSATCSPCAKGRYTDATTKACTDCPAGTISDDAGECAVCNNGRYSSAKTTTTTQFVISSTTANADYGLAPRTLCTECDGYLRIENVVGVKSDDKLNAILGGTECIKLGPLQSLEWWHLLLIILASAVLAVVVARYVLRGTTRYTGGVLDAVTMGRGRRAVGSVFGNQPADTDKALEMDNLQPKPTLNY